MQHKAKSQTQKKNKIPVIDVHTMEQDLVDSKPRFQQITTSKLVKEMKVNNEEVYQFKNKHLNPDAVVDEVAEERKANFIEFLLNMRNKTSNEMIEKTKTQNINEIYNHGPLEL